MQDSNKPSGLPGPVSYLGGAVVLLFALLYFLHPGIPLGSLSTDQKSELANTWPLFVPYAGQLFLASLFLHFILFSGILITLARGKANRWLVVSWLILLVIILVTGLRSLAAFDRLNPFFINWHLKCVAFAIMSTFAWLIAWIVHRFLPTNETAQPHHPVYNGTQIDPIPSRYSLLKKYPEITPNHKHFIKKTIDLLDEHIADSGLDISFLADKLHMSEPTFRRRIQDAIDMTPGVFIKQQRLAKAKELEASGRIESHKELAAAVGFKSPAYFMTVYRKYLDQL